MKMKYFLSSFSILFCSFVFFSSNSISESNRFETQTILNSFDLLPQTVISTNYYRIDQTVLNDGYLNKFHIRSQFGDQFVLGSSMLAIRINELKALNELSKISSAKVIKDSALDNGEKIITTPINVGKKVIGLVEDPDKIITTAKSIPDGVGNIFSWASRQVQGGLEYANKQMFDESKKKSKNNSDDLDSENETTEKAVELAKKSGLKYIKYSSAEREWFKKLSVDQYTDNEQLQNEIERVAGIQTAMNFGFKFVPGFNLGLLGEVNKWYSRAEELGVYEPFDILFDKNESKLDSLGVDKKIQKQFFTNKKIWPSMQALLVDCVEKLQQNYPKIKGREKFILLTSTTTSTEGALYYVESCGILNKLKEKNIKLEKIISTDLVPAAISKNGELIIPVAIDYLLWTKEVSSAFEKIKSSYKKNSKKNSVVLALKGRTSDLAMSNLVSQKVKVIQQVY